jgi:hypothetical protein
VTYFKITTADGQVFVGSVQGFGGQLGGGAAHLGRERENAAASRELHRCIEVINTTGRWGPSVLEHRSKPGHCIVKSVMDWKVPHHSAFNSQFVPLAGATATVLTDDEIRGIAPGTCRISTFVAFGHEVHTATFESDDDANKFMTANPGYGLIGIDGKGARHVAKNGDKGTELPPITRLKCCCCGASFNGRQFNNQDVGFGLGDCCVEYVSRRTEDMTRTYGRRGIHYSVLDANK